MRLGGMGEDRRSTAYAHRVQGNYVRLRAVRIRLTPHSRGVSSHTDDCGWRGTLRPKKVNYHFSMHVVVTRLSMQLRKQLLLTHPKFGCLVLLCAAPMPAWASDPSGMATILFGVPGMVCAIALAGLLLQLPSRPWRRVLTLVVFVPVLLAAALVSLDALTMWRRGVAETVFALAYFGLVGALVILVRKLLKPPGSPSQ